MTWREKVRQIISRVRERSESNDKFKMADKNAFPINESGYLKRKIWDEEVEKAIKPIEVPRKSKTSNGIF